MPNNYKNNDFKFGNVSDYPYLYDMLHNNAYSDIDFYAELSENYSEILEIGIGTGRLAIPLAKYGKIIYGLDNSKQMISFLKNKLEQESPDIRSRINIIQGNMCNFNLKKKFKFIYVPYMTFNYLLDIESQLECLSCLYSHLEKGGVLILDLISFYPEWFLDDKISRLVFRGENALNNGITDVYRVVRFDPSNQLLEHDRVYKHYDNSGKLIEEQIVYFKNRFMLAGEITLLLKTAGFNIKSIYGDYKKSKYSKNSQTMLIISTNA